MDAMVGGGRDKPPGMISCYFAATFLMSTNNFLFPMFSWRGRVSRGQEPLYPRTEQAQRRVARLDALKCGGFMSDGALEVATQEGQIVVSQAEAATAPNFRSWPCYTFNRHGDDLGQRYSAACFGMTGRCVDGPRF